MKKIQAGIDFIADTLNTTKSSKILIKQNSILYKAQISANYFDILQYADTLSHDPPFYTENNHLRIREVLFEKSFSQNTNFYNFKQSEQDNNTIITSNNPLNIPIGSSDITQIHAATEPGTPIRIVFVPSSLFNLATQFNDYTTHVDDMWKYIYKHFYFRDYKERFSVWRIDTILPNDIMYVPDGQGGKVPFPKEDEIGPWVLNKLSPYVPIGTISYQKTSLLGKHGRPIGFIIIFLINDSAKGNVQGHPNFLYITTDSTKDVIHEFGHAFGGLGDEYYKGISFNFSPDKSIPNLAGNLGEAKKKWGDMEGLIYNSYPDSPSKIATYWNTKIGYYLGGSASNWYRPTIVPSLKAPDGLFYYSYCIMGQASGFDINNWPFCPVCHRHIESIMRNYGTGLKVTFEKFPDGTKVKGNLKNRLKGNEFLARGVKFSNPFSFSSVLMISQGTFKDIMVKENAYIDEHQIFPSKEIIPYIINPFTEIFSRKNIDPPIPHPPSYKDVFYLTTSHPTDGIQMDFDFMLREISVFFYGEPARYILTAYFRTGMITQKLNTIFRDVTKTKELYQLTLKITQPAINQCIFRSNGAKIMIVSLSYS